MTATVTLLPGTRVIPVEHWQLVDKESGRQVYPGEDFLTFRGELVTLKGGQPPHKVGSSGRVYVEDETGFESSFFPSVIDLMWVEVDNGD